MFDFDDLAFDSSSSFQQNTEPYIPEASECMRCGMCVSSCPTFRLFNIDQETPRHRIRSISKLIVEQQTISEQEQQHLLNCLQCRACEQICPSRMAYGQLFDQALTKIKLPISSLAKIGLWLIAEKKWRKRLLPFINGYFKLALRKPLQKTGLLDKLSLASAEALLTKPALTPLSEVYPATRTKLGKVGLFTGCLAEHFDQETLLAAIKLLNYIGYDVLIPGQQSCCGAIHQHNGLDAQLFIKQNIQVFNDLDIDAVLYSATGCGVMLTEYPTTDQASSDFVARLADINQFILQHWPDDGSLHPLNLTVAVHEPCSQRNILKNQQAVYQLLAKIPQLNVLSLPENQICCGAGGSYMLSHPENAQQLRNNKAKLFAECHAQLLISSNYACAVFLQIKIKKICHPLVLLAGQLTGK